MGFIKFKITKDDITINDGYKDFSCNKNELYIDITKKDKIIFFNTKNKKKLIIENRSLDNDFKTIWEWYVS